MKRTRSPWLAIRRSSIHGRGGYARTDISVGTRVIEYVGEKITKAESERRCDAQMERHVRNKKEGAVYVFELNKRYDVDGRVSWNTARWINHSCEPNCEPQIIRGHIWIIALRDIGEGEEITYNYGYDEQNWKDHPCRCRSKRCLGYIVGEDHRSKLQRILRRREREKLGRKRRRRRKNDPRVKSRR